MRYQDYLLFLSKDKQPLVNMLKTTRVKWSVAWLGQP